MQKLPFLTEGDALLVDTAAWEAIAMLEPYLRKMPETLEDDLTVFTLVERTMVADLAAISLLMRRAAAGATGEAGVAPQAATFLKKGVAGEVEAEFDVVKGADNPALRASHDELRTALLSSLNMKAPQYGFRVEIIGSLVNICPNIQPTSPPFRMFC